MNKKYLVAYIIDNIHNPLEHNKDQYAAFIDTDDNLKNAKEFYQVLLLDEDLYSANLCEIIKSTDY